MYIVADEAYCGVALNVNPAAAPTTTSVQNVISNQRRRMIRR